MTRTEIERFGELDKQFEKIEKAIAREVKKRKLPTPPNKTWILDALVRHEENFKNSIFDLAIKSVVNDWRDHLLKEEGVGKHGKSKVAEEFEIDDSFSGMGQSLELAQELQPIAEEFRQETWGKPTVPFETMDDAKTWLQKCQQEDRDSYEEIIRHKITFKINISQNKEALRAFIEKSNEISKIDFDNVGQCFDFVRDEFIGGKVVNCIFDGGFPRLLIRFPSGERLHFLIYAYGTSAKLYEACGEIVQASGWWSHEEALRFILCGNVPYAGIYPRPSLSIDNNKMQKIILEIYGPATEEEVLRTYKNVLDAYGVKPKKLNYNQAQLLRLVYEMPLGTYTWSQRLQRWLEWHKSSKLSRFMRTYKAELMPDGTIKNKEEASDNIRNEYNRAKAKAKDSWKFTKIPFGSAKD